MNIKKEKLEVGEAIAASFFKVMFKGGLALSVAGGLLVGSSVSFTLRAMAGESVEVTNCLMLAFSMGLLVGAAAYLHQSYMNHKQVISAYERMCKLRRAHSELASENLNLKFELIEATERARELTKNEC